MHMKSSPRLKFEIYLGLLYILNSSELRVAKDFRRRMMASTASSYPAAQRELTTYTLQRNRLMRRQEYIKLQLCKR